jgi:aminopeptidase N
MEHQVVLHTEWLSKWDLSGTGWGLFDFIIIHESGHEWFANNITYKDIADMWIHESFTNYSESLFWNITMERRYTYIRGLRNSIENDIPYHCK